MATYSQTPGRMNLTVKQGDTLSVLVDFDTVDVTGYTVTSQVTSLVTGSQVVPMTTSVTDAVAGKVNVALTKQQTAAIPAGSYGWEMLWDTPARRTALTGIFEVTR
jgi:hypothetical protein